MKCTVEVVSTSRKGRKAKTVSARKMDGKGQTRLADEIDFDAKEPTRCDAFASVFNDKGVPTPELKMRRPSRRKQTSMLPRPYGSTRKSKYLDNASLDDFKFCDLELRPTKVPPIWVRQNGH